MFRRNQNRLLFPERRSHVRIVTLRNFGWLTIAMIIAFMAITIRSEMRGLHPHDYGRLVGKQIPTNVERKPPVEPVTEATTPAAEPQLQTQPMSIVPAEPMPTPVTTHMVPQGGDTHVVIVGGPEGLTVVQQVRRRPQLKGGFGR